MRPLIRFLALPLSVCTSVLLVVSPASVLATSYVFNVQLANECQGGVGPASETVKVVLTSAAGDKIDAETTSTATNGFWEVCFPTDVHPGMQLSVKHGGVGQRSITVPSLSVATDRVGNVVSGRGPAGTTLQVAVTRCSMHGNCSEQDYATATNTSGQYHLGLNTASPAYDLQGNDQVVATYSMPMGDTVATATYVSYMIVEFPSLVVIQGVRPGRSVTVKLKADDGSLRVTSTKLITNPFANPIPLTKNGSNVTIHTGNVVRASFASDADFKWDVALTGNTGDNTVSGRCFRNAEIRVALTHNGNGEADFSNTQPDGTFSFDFSGLGVHSGDGLDMTCRNTRGDELTYTSSVP